VAACQTVKLAIYTFEVNRYLWILRIISQIGIVGVYDPCLAGGKSKLAKDNLWRRIIDYIQS
jgi:hypothetical protein